MKITKCSLSSTFSYNYLTPLSRRARIDHFQVHILIGGHYNNSLKIYGHPMSHLQRYQYLLFTQISYRTSLNTFGYPPNANIPGLEAKNDGRPSTYSPFSSEAILSLSFIHLNISNDTSQTRELAHEDGPTVFIYLGPFARA